MYVSVLCESTSVVYKNNQKKNLSCEQIPSLSFFLSRRVSVYMPICVWFNIYMKSDSSEYRMKHSISLRNNGIKSQN